MGNNSYIERKKNGNSFIFIKNGQKITDKNLLEKCKSIYIAPAYTNVKIYLGEKLLATGYDKAGRKQYIYSTEMKNLREKKKLKQLKKIGVHIDRLHRTINNDLSQKEMTKTKLVALILKIMEMCNFRNGSKVYEKKYGSYGITTIHKKHLTFKNNGVQIKFIGKKGVENNCTICDKRVNDLLKEVYQMSSRDNNYLFSIKNRANEFIQVHKEDVNQYLARFDITSKDLRTWNANIIFLRNFRKQLKSINSRYNNKTNRQKMLIRKKMIKEAIVKTAEELHNTPAVCKSSYIYKNIVKYLENCSGNIKKIFDDNENIENNLKRFLNSI